MGALRKLDKSAASTIRMAEIIRPRAQLVFDRLKADVPKAYQEHSSAHPYLPFFHRLEGVLKGLATFGEYNCIGIYETHSVIIFCLLCYSSDVNLLATYLMPFGLADVFFYIPSSLQRSD